MAVYGTYNIQAKTFQGVSEGLLIFNEDGTGRVEAMGMEAPLDDIVIDGDKVSCVCNASHPKMGKLTIKVKAEVTGDEIKGTLKMKVGGARFNGTRA